MYDRPLVSVLMTSYNRQKYIAESINSVLSSTYKNFELIIVDDASSDNTVAIAREFEVKDERVKVFVNNENLTDYQNRNKAASYATGKYIKYLDSDDIIYPWGLEAMVNCMEQFSEAGFGLISYGIPVGTRFPFLLTPSAAYHSYFFQGAMIITGPTGAIIRKDVFDSLNGFSGKRFIGDTELWLLLSKKYSVVAMPLDLVWWRQHDDQQIKEELSNNSVEVQRYHLYKDSITSVDSPLSKRQRILALRNLKNLKARNLFKLLLKGQIKKSVFLYKAFDLNLKDLIKSLRFNQYPSNSKN